ncbi:hypothetical protein FHX52_3675 [Humibacillus xanthopallidus]|uniref:Lipoprotein LprG n=1 Tax=Humibacillus xanthopallidus TaxID=412689 RepID=A0A543PK49_9MICO|nr:hypothetical protein [Humibacillus xanthopallidus]TQN44462.1 hypothetical protein FHX52_3675 [Humibacillus xanthopallidus]
MKVAARAGVVVAVGVLLALAGCGPSPTTPSSDATRAVARGTRTQPPSASATGATASSGSATLDPSAPSSKAVLAKAEARAKALRSGAYEARFTGGKEPVRISFRGSRTDYGILLVVGATEAVFYIHGATAYIRGNAQFWAQARTPDPGKDVFIEVPTNRIGPATDLTLERTLRQLITTASARVVPEVTNAESQGISSWSLTDRRGARAGTVYISKDTFDVIRVSDRDRDVATFEFYGWNDTFAVPTPPRSKILKGPPRGGVSGYTA